MNNFTNDIIDPEIKFTISEEAPEGGNSGVLGKVTGNFFVPDGTSRNKRFYPKSLWEKVCSNPAIKRKFDEKLMFGTIGHGQKIDDFTLLDGKMSHIVTGLRIEGNQGIGEALILDTPAGRILNTVLRAGSVLRVSSRANGTFKGEQNGVPIVDPDSYSLETFDFVIDPGFFQANPKLAESLEKMMAETTVTSLTEEIKGDQEMDKTLLENMAKENATLKAQLEQAAGEVETLKNENVVIKDKLKHTEFNYEKIKGFKAANEELKKELSEFKALGTVEEMKTLVENTEKHIAEVGSFSESKQALVESEKVISEYIAIGKPERIKEALHKSFTLLAEYKARGSLSDIDVLLERVSKIVAEGNETKKKAAIAKLAADIGVSEDKVAKMFGKMTEEEIKEVFKDAKAEAKISSTFAKRVTEEKKPEDKPAEANKSKIFGSTSGARLFESLTSR